SARGPGARGRGRRARRCRARGRRQPRGAHTRLPGALPPGERSGAPRRLRAGGRRGRPLGRGPAPARPPGAPARRPRPGGGGGPGAGGRGGIGGGGAWAILAREPGALHARVVAPRPFRLAQLVTRLGVDAKAAPALLDRTDSERTRYFREYYDLDVNDPTHFDLVLNSERLGTDGASDLIVARARALGAR